MSPRIDLGNTSTISLTLDARDQPRQHLVAASSGVEHLHLRLCNRIESSHHSPQLPHNHTTGRNQTTVYGRARANVQLDPMLRSGVREGDINMPSTVVGVDFIPALQSNYLYLHKLTQKIQCGNKLLLQLRCWEWV